MSASRCLASVPVTTPVWKNAIGVDVHLQTLENLLLGTRLVRPAWAPWLEYLGALAIFLAIGLYAARLAYARAAAQQQRWPPVSKAVRLRSAAVLARAIGVRQRVARCGDDDAAWRRVAYFASSAEALRPVPCASSCNPSRSLVPRHVWGC